MNYQKVYNTIINRAKDRILTEYSERHHIIPKCLGGNNSKQNIVILTAKEHYIVHHLLTKIYPENKKLIYAFWMMCNGSRIERPIPNASMYEEAKYLFSKARTGWKSPLKGTHLSEETKDKISITKQGKNNWKGRKPIIYLTKELRLENELKRRENISKSHKGKKMSEGSRIKGSNSKLGSKNPMFGKTGELNNRSVKIELFENNILKTTFSSATEVSKKLNISIQTVFNYIENKSKIKQFDLRRSIVLKTN